MSLQQRAAQAAKLEDDRLAAEREARTVAAKERDIALTRRWWNDTIGEPRAEFWLPLGWAPSGLGPIGLVTCDGWAIAVSPRKYHENAYGASWQDDLTGYVVLGTTASGRSLRVHRGRWGGGRITSLASLARLFDEIGDPPDLDFGELMLAGEYDPLKEA